MMSEKLDSVREYLSSLTEMRKSHAKIPDWKYCCTEELVLSEGVHFTPAPLPKGVERGEVKMCYRNAFELCFENPEFTYCEGYAEGEFIPLPHAWAVNSDGEVLELTWPKLGGTYFGIPFKIEYVRERILSSEYYSVLDNWTEGWPLLQNGVDGLVETRLLTQGA